MSKFSVLGMISVLAVAVLPAILNVDCLTETDQPPIFQNTLEC
jgi:hypothetical protein